MIRIETRKAKIITFLGTTVFVFGVLFFLLRGPYLSNSIKRIIIPVLENATRERILIDKAVVNLFPFYVQAKGFKLFDKDGNRLLWVTKTRAYIDLTSLLTNQITIRQLTLKEPELTADRKDLQRIMDNINKSSSAGGKGKYGVSLKNIKMTEGILRYSDLEKSYEVSGRGLYLNVLARGRSASIDVLLEEGKLAHSDRPELPLRFQGAMKFEDGNFYISDVRLNSSKSELRMQGKVMFADNGRVAGGSLIGRTTIYPDTLAGVFGLKQDRDGVLSFDGSVELVEQKDSKLPAFAFNLNTESRFYLETLMEIIGVDEDITGKVSVSGSIRGTFPDLYAEGTAGLENAVFAGFPIDNLSGDIAYEKMKFALHDFTAHTYEGEFRGDAYITVPDGDYRIKGTISDMSSPEFFDFIKWEPPLQDGGISGTVQLDHEHGHPLAITADLDYQNMTDLERGLSGRIRNVHSKLELREGIISLTDTVLSTKQTDLYMNGYVDLNEKEVDLDLMMKTGNAVDLTAPDYTRLSAPAFFRGKAEGPAGDPVISGRIEMDAGSIEGIGFRKASADFSYRKDSLSVEKIQIFQEKAGYEGSGSILFRKTEGLFSFKDPFYRLDARIENADLGRFIKTLYKEIPVSGTVEGVIAFEGDSADFRGSGDLVVHDARIYEQHVDRALVKAVLTPSGIEFPSITAFNGSSNLAAGGTVFFDKKISFSATSNNILLDDISVAHDWPVDAAFNISIDGSGTIDDPEMEFSISVRESSFRKTRLGAGRIEGTFKDMELAAGGSFVDGAVTAGGGMKVSASPSWSANVNIRKGRYDFLLTDYLKEVPEDFLLDFEGDIELRGEGSSLSMKSRFSSVRLVLYGYSFENSQDIVFSMADKEFRIESFFLSGKNAGLSLGGSTVLNEWYNLKLEGNLDVTPLRVFTGGISSLKGQSDFNINIAGPWTDPEFTGEIHIRNTTAAFNDFTYKIGPVNGSLYLKKDRIVFDSLNTGFAGGSIVMSGAGYLDEFSIKRLFVSSQLQGIRIRPAEGLSTVFNGKLFYEFSPDSSTLTGGIDIKKARYDKKFEFASFLLGLKETKEIPPEYPSFVAETELNVRIAGSDNIIIDNNIARTPIKVDVNVMGTVKKYGLIGRVEADEGNVFFRGNEFKVLKGSSVEFIEPNRISPLLHIMAETYKNNYYIKLTLDDTLERPHLSLFSEPPLSEDEILALLTFGQVKRESKGFEGGIAASEATSLITGGLQGEVEERVKSITGFERFEVEPHTTTAGAFAPKVTVGKRLLEDRLSVIYSTPVGSTEENEIKLRYDLNNNVSVEGSRNEIGSAGVDLKYKFKFK